MIQLPILLLPLLALADVPLPPPRPMRMPETNPLAPKALVIGQFPDCSALAETPGVPEPLKLRLQQAGTRAKAWQQLYTQTWGEYGDFEKRCRAYVSGAERKTQAAIPTVTSSDLESGLQLHLGELRVEAVSLSPPTKPSAVKLIPGSLLLLKNDVNAVQETFKNAKDSNRADLASKCAGALAEQAAAITSAMNRFEGHAKTVCVPPAASGDSESNTGK